MAHTHLGRAVKNIEAPRPLKTQSRSSLKNSYLVIEELIQLIDNVTVGLQSCNTTTESITLLLHNLRVHGPQLEAVSKDTLDRAFVVFRNASQDERLNIMTRLKLLELIELRAKSWEDNDTIAYYKSKQQVSNELPPEPYQHDASGQQGGFLSTSPTFAAAAAVFNAASAAAAAQAAAIAAVGSPNQQHMLLHPGEVIRNSGKFLKPTKIPGKTYCKDEVVIRNADSGKVMGIKGRRVHMIEELSETIISFQRVNPGAKERLVQITGPAEEKINYAKQLMEDTIRRNASPVRLEPAPAAGGSCSSLNSSNSDDAVVVQPRTPGGSSLANRLSFNSAQNFMTAQQAAAQQISQISQHQQAHQQQQHHHQQQVAAIQVAAAAAQAQATAAAGKVLRPSQQLLMHSYSTNDASVGEYKFTVNVGQRLIKITGDCCELVRVAKLVLDDYFSSSEFLASMEAGAAFDGTSLVSPVTTPSTPLPGAGPPQFMLPLADSGIGLNYAASSANNNGDGDDEVFTETTNGASPNAANQNGLARSRRSHFSRKESTPESKGAREKLDVEERPLKTNASRVSYDIEHLIYYSQSPHAWALPNDWEKMLETSPSIVRNKVIHSPDVQLKCIRRPSSSLDSITNAPKSFALTTASTAIYPEGDAQVAVAVANATTESSSDSSTLTETNKQSRVSPQERELRRNPKPSAESDRNLYNRQLQIITSTMGAKTQAKCRQQPQPLLPPLHSNHSLSQAKAIFQRYTEDDECLMAWFDDHSHPELNNNRTFV
ncbi:eukaryotic translation initiation factor 4E-binding protein Mextli isoform X2 [Drosophila persimilis]|uniref:eukaryotic translation initiation factor 4E-binding protein Mextli isoform X2 n=1 Tax=Drosophila persimilis TaxID=7234 RepID=UPI000F084E16|nr:eukaryotic translation initiation factor 4E-binding protein Mextli isoform X2 [Drosophila persimilis]